MSNDQIITYLYVNDLLVTRSNEVELIIFKANIKNEFEMLNLGNLTYFL